METKNKKKLLQDLKVQKVEVEGFIEYYHGCRYFKNDGLKMIHIILGYLLKQNMAIRYLMKEGSKQER